MPLAITGVIAPLVLGVCAEGPISRSPSICTIFSTPAPASRVHDVLPPPSQRLVFIPVPEKPPEEKNFEFLHQTSLKNFMGLDFSAVSGFPDKNFLANNSAARPLLLISFDLRPRLHHSLFLQIDGLLHACFRLRLERDVCVLPNDTSFCYVSGPGVSPASTFCGLFWPTPPLLAAVLRAVKYERGYGVFV